MEKIKINKKDVENIKINKRDNAVIVSVNPSIYPLEVVYSAAYMFLDKVYVFIDGNTDKEILVKLKPKNKGEDLEELAGLFNNELVNYSVYVIQAARSSSIRDAIIRVALAVEKTGEPEEESDTEEESDEEKSFVEDPLGIAKPWTPEKAKGIKAPEEIKNLLEEKNDKNEQER